MKSGGDVQEPLDLQVIFVPPNHDECIFIFDFEGGMVDGDMLDKLALLPAVGGTVKTADNDSIELNSGLLWSNKSPNYFKIFGGDYIQFCECEVTFNQGYCCAPSSSVRARVGNVVDSFQLKGFFNHVLMILVFLTFPNFGMQP